MTDLVKASSPANLLVHHTFLHPGGVQGQDARAPATISIISRLAADSRRSATIAGAQASRRERMWPDVQVPEDRKQQQHDQLPKQKQKQQPELQLPKQQQPQEELVVKRHETPTKPTTTAATARPVQLVTKPAVTVATAVQAVKAVVGSATTPTAADTKAAVQSNNDKKAASEAAEGKPVPKTAGAATEGKPVPKTAGAAAATAAAKATVATGASTLRASSAATGAGDKFDKAHDAAVAIRTAKARDHTAFPPFVKPVARYAGRVSSPPPIVGVVFYGRRDRVRILDCYLQRNMAHNGGLLTSVVFVTATWQPADVAFLDRLIALRGKDYRKLYPERLDKGYTGHYAWMDPATMYVKIDDDVVYIADEAIDHMLIAHNLNKYHLISANVVNHQPLELPHSQKGAHTTYEQAIPGDKSSWRAVMRPVAAAANTGTAAAGSTSTTVQPVTFMDNGWDVWGDWRRAANVHYSFLANQAAGRLGVYEFSAGEELWDFNRHFGYTRWRINMIMFKGATIDVHVYNMSSTVATYPGDDEDFITRILPQQLNRTSAAVSKALAVHFSFYMQRAGLENSTDLLDRYALLAERTCGRLVPAE